MDDEAICERYRGNHDRRCQPRFREWFPASIFSSERGQEHQILHATATDYTQEGICLRSKVALRRGQRVVVQFNLPESVRSAPVGLRCEFAGIVSQVRPIDISPTEQRDPSMTDRYVLIVRWERSLPSLIRRAVYHRRRQAGVALMLLIACMAYLKWGNLQFFWYAPGVYTYSLILGAFYLSRFLLSCLYRAPKMSGYEPSISVVISVKNEEHFIARTVESCFRAQYPDDKREIIVVNDGSTDATPAILKALQQRFPNLKVYNLPSSGKRHAMATGVRAASGEIIVFLDSDTFVYPTAFRRIVCGFEDPTLGAVSGHTDVENADKNTLTRMQELRYLVSYKLMKASESVFSCVTCCPGCLSAYRRSYLMPILDPWLGQRFLGAQATFGDDRSLTNFILRNYRVIYNETAVSTTLVPATWSHYMRQQVRWKKSWLRETLIAGRFVCRKNPLGALSFYAAALCSTASPWIAYKTLLGGIWGGQTAELSYYIGGFVILGLSQCFYFLWKSPTSPNWLLGVLMMAVQGALMGPQTYYAFLTMRKNHWGTR